jgi:hypothetical protein
MHVVRVTLVIGSHIAASSSMSSFDAFEYRVIGAFGQ